MVFLAFPQQFFEALGLGLLRRERYPAASVLLALLLSFCFWTVLSLIPLLEERYSLFSLYFQLTLSALVSMCASRPCPRLNGRIGVILALFFWNGAGDCYRHRVFAWTAPAFLRDLRGSALRLAAPALTGPNFGFQEHAFALFCVAQ